MTASSPAAGASPLALLRRVRVGTTNPPKLDAVRSALAPFAPDARIEGVAVESGVPEQPVGFDEIVRGARNRARLALEGEGARCDLGVGIEDGLVALPGAGEGDPEAFVNVGCAAVADGHRVHLGFSSGFAYPGACTAPAVEAREPIGPLLDRLWARARADAPELPSALTTGNVGKLTLGVLPRSEYARHAVVCALVPLLHPDLYGPRERAA